ncbi:hypothetical protein [Pseudomonas chlororaphis]|uniref:hypothetical protein n=1 Tax=Pseudomonas chlororaphis TaxID=587753 RepID=UPI001B309783|nr:hypothetical protein [Pseudomonas chlororaphis]MBP5059200.1 hypothetical protein [Pseudomonas chlororaphis]MBP5142973.1 hypothetical protein [Pseudomonas chlororaphis]QTT98290.1 hypothetical protein HUT26_02980 [Pseudomonas chlororaphis]
MLDRDTLKDLRHARNMEVTSMKYGMHYFSPNLHNEVRCGLCGEYLTDNQHIQAIGRPAPTSRSRRLAAGYEARRRRAFLLRV